MARINIHTPRLLIRPLQLEDLSDFHLYRSQTEVVKYQGSDVMSQEQAAEFIKDNSGKTFGKKGQWVQYGIEHRASHKLVGDCAIQLDRNDARIAQVGITISHLYQRKGYAKEVLSGLLDFLFDTQSIHRVVEIVDVENTASIALMKSLGFRQEGHFIENVFFKGKWGSEYQFAMLRKEWQDRLIN